MNSELLRLEIETLLKQEQNTAALERAGALIQFAPDLGRNWNVYGRALLACNYANESLQAFEQAVRLDPADVQTRTSMAEMLRRLGRYDEAVHWHAEALARDPHSLVLALNHAFIWPNVPESHAQIDHYRGRCREEFDRLKADPELYLHPEHEAIMHTVWMAYHGMDDRLWLEEYADLVTRHLTPSAPSRFKGVLRRTPPKGRRLRLGFLSAYFSAHSNTRAFEGLLQGLDRDRFALVMIHLAGSRHDTVQVRLETLADQVVRLPDDPQHAMMQLDALNLDLLYVTDVGIHPGIPPLLSRRFAPVQVTGWGFPVTSGFSSIDYYLSGDVVEPANADEHYRETLIRLSGLPCRYLSQDLPMDPMAGSMGRDYFMLPHDRPLVGCLQMLVKFHPDFDTVLERIARAVPDVMFVFIGFATNEIIQLFLTRLQQNAPLAAERTIFVGQQSRPEFSVLASVLDLMLDTPHFGAGISFYESIHTGTPIVTTEGAFLRSRYVEAGYRMMDIDDAPVGKNLTEMADVAIALLNNPERRERLRERIREAALTRLYDRMDVVHSFEDFAVEAIERADWESQAANVASAPDV